MGMHQHQQQQLVLLRPAKRGQVLLQGLGPLVVVAQLGQQQKGLQGLSLGQLHLKKS
jgi:hypothetical protein